MRNFKLVSIVLGLMVGMVALSHAGGLTKPRKNSVVSYSTSGSLVTSGPGAVFQVVMSTGAASEFAILVDSGSATGVVATQTTKLIAPRMFYASTSSNTVVTFDPPVLFSNGLVVIGSAATGQIGVTFESGRLGGN